MDGHLASVWDRLNNAPTRLTPEHFKHRVKHDLEALLNTRVATGDDVLAAFPHCRHSILTFGLIDFAQLCLGSGADREAICLGLKTSIERHEPRLTKVRVTLAHEPGTINRLAFVISGQLRALAGCDRFEFDVTLEPSSLQYSVR